MAADAAVPSARRRIALVYPKHADIGGAELFLNQLATRLAEEGHEVSIVCRKHGTRPHPNVRFVELTARSIGNAWRTWAFARAAARHVAERDYDVVVGLGRTWSQDVLRCGGGLRETYAEAERRFRRPPGERRIQSRGLKERVALSIERRALAPGAYRRVLTNSRLLADDLQRRYSVPDDKISIVYNGVDVERFHPARREREGREMRRALELGEDTLLALFVGLGFARKGLVPLLEALPQAVASRPELHLLVAGTDRHRGAYERLAGQLGLDAHVHFLGRRSDLEACYAASDLHVLPTYYDSFGYTVLEALATGLPVLTTANAGAAELLTSGTHGKVLPADFGHEELAQALVEWADRDRLLAAAPAARALAEEHTLRRASGEAARVVLEAND